MAGAGTYSGNNKLGVTGTVRGERFLPDREGNITPDPPGTFISATTTYCSSLAGERHHHAHVRASDVGADNASRPDATETRRVESECGSPDCPSSDELCGFREGMQVMIFDDTGASDIFSITNVQYVGAPSAAQGTGFVEGVRGNTYITQISLRPRTG
jgi:hypothetical protein